MVPVVQVYKGIYLQPPTLQELEGTSFLNVRERPNGVIDKHTTEAERRCVLLLSTSNRVIPKSALFYLGNTEVKDKILRENETFFSCIALGWKGTKWNQTIESFLLKQQLAWGNDESSSIDSS